MLGAAENWKGPCVRSPQDRRSGVTVNVCSPWWHPFWYLKILEARSVGRLLPWPSNPSLVPLPIAGRPLTLNPGLSLPLFPPFFFLIEGKFIFWDLGVEFSGEMASWGWGGWGGMAAIMSFRATWTIFSGLCFGHCLFATNSEEGHVGRMSP